MGRSINDAAVRDVRTKLSKEECASSMGRHRSANYAALMDVRTKLGKEELASSMERHGSANDAAVKDVRTKLRKEEFASGTGHIAYKEFIALVYFLGVNSGVLFIYT